MVTLLDQLAARHTDWIKMAISIGCDPVTAQDVVQDMYIRMHKFVQDPSRITDDSGRINSLYVFVTIRNLIRNQYTGINSKMDASEDMIELDQESNDVLITQSDLNEASIELEHCIRCEVESWHHYDQKLWTLYWSSEEMTMRKIHEETKISLSSIYTSLKNGKERIQTACKKHFNEYKEAFGETQDASGWSWRRR